MNGFYEILETFAHPHYPKCVTTVVGVDGIEVARIERQSQIAYKVSFVDGGECYVDLLANALLRVQISVEMRNGWQPSPYIKSAWQKRVYLDYLSRTDAGDLIPIEKGKYYF